MWSSAFDEFGVVDEDLLPDLLDRPGPGDVAGAELSEEARLRALDEHRRRFRVVGPTGPAFDYGAPDHPVFRLCGVAGCQQRRGDLYPHEPGGFGCPVPF